MTLGAIVDILFVRRRRTFLGVFAFVLALTALITFALPKRYQATATLFVGENRPVATGANSVPLDEVLAQSYRSLLGTPAIRAAAATALHNRPSGDQLAGKLSFDIEPGTHLITVSATDGSPKQALRIANTYASTFVRVIARTAAGNGEDRLRALRQRIGALAVETQQLQGQHGAGGVARLVAAQNELAAARAAYATVTENSSFEGTNVALASPAALPDSPSSPKPKLDLAVGAFLALLLAGIAAFVRESLDESVKESDEMSRIFDAPVLAYVPETGPLHRVSDQVVRESFEFLRTNLELIGQSQGRHVRTVAVTAPTPGTGKTFVVSELAKALAAAGTSVLALDLDLRRSALGQKLGVDPSSGGVTEVLMGTSNAREVVRVGEGGAQVLAAGRTPPDPPLLLGSPRMGHLLEELGTHVDQVLVDTPPVLAAPETSVVATLVDALIMVVDARDARRKSLVAAREQVDKAGARIVGVVVNHVTRGSGFDLYYGYGYYGSASRTANGSGRKQALPIGLNGDRRDHEPAPHGPALAPSQPEPEPVAVPDERVGMPDEPISMRDEPTSMRAEPISMRDEPTSMRDEPLHMRSGAEAPARAASRPRVPLWADPTPLDLNDATLEDLMLLPGIGRRPAERILALREESGGITSLDDLLDVEGMTREKVMKIAPYVRL